MALLEKRGNIGVPRPVGLRREPGPGAQLPLEEQQQMRTIRLAGSGVLAALAMMIGGQQATAQEASGQFYGYPSKQAPMATGQGGSGGGAGWCNVEKWGCHVEVCPPPSC